MKNIIKKSLQALLLVPVMAFAVSVMSPLATQVYAETGGILDGAQAAKDDSQSENLDANFKIITNTLLFVVGAISVIMLIIGGIRYTVSGGDSGQITAAKNTILYAIVGIIISLLAFAIVNFFAGQFAGNA